MLQSTYTGKYTIKLVARPETVKHMSRTLCIYST